MTLVNQFRGPSGVKEIKSKVYYTGSDAIANGYGVCFDRDYGTATDAEKDRDIRVAKPDNTNNNSFAGVAARSYSAVSGGQWIEICEPGSIAYVYVDASTTIGENTFVTCQIGGGGSGTFDVPGTAAQQGFVGRGSARVMQTRTGAGLILAELMSGRESGLVETIQAVDNTAVPMMKGGVTIVTGGITIGTGDSTDTLAQGTYEGMQKKIVLVGALTTNDYTVSLATAGEQLDGTTDLASLEFDGAGDVSTLTFLAGKWRLSANTGTGLA
jgi:hypothetical protein